MKSGPKGIARPPMNPTLIQAQLDQLEVLKDPPADKNIVISIGAQQLKRMMENSVLLGKIQQHAHFGHVLTGIDQSLAQPCSSHLADGRREVLHLLFDLLAGESYERAVELNNHLRLVKDEPT